MELLGSALYCTCQDGRLYVPFPPPPPSPSIFFPSFSLVGGQDVLKAVEIVQNKRNGKVTRDLTFWRKTFALNIFSPPVVNDFRTIRVAETLGDFQSIQYFIAAAPVDPPNMDDYYTEGWCTLRQCNIDGQHVLNCGADTSVPVTTGGPDEQAKAELRQSVVHIHFE